MPKATPRQRAHPGPPEGGAEVPAAEVLRQGGAGPERGDLPGGAPEPGAVLGAPGQGAPVAQAVAEGARVEAPLREVVRRREAQRLRQLPGPPRRGPAPQQGRDHLGGRARRQPRADLPGPLARGQPLRRRAPAPRRQEGRHRHHLHADDPGAPDRDARLRAHRRAPQRGVRRVRARVAPRPDQRLQGQGRDHGRRQLPARRAGPAQEEHRRRRSRSARRSTPSSSTSGPARRSAGSRTATSGGTTS